MTLSGGANKEPILADASTNTLAHYALYLQIICFIVDWRHLKALDVLKHDQQPDATGCEL